MILIVVGDYEKIQGAHIPAYHIRYYLVSIVLVAAVKQHIETGGGYEESVALTGVIDRKGKGDSAGDCVFLRFFRAAAEIKGKQCR